MPLTYKDSGVNYDIMDPFKAMAIKAARLTAKNLKAHGFTEVTESRGESVYLIETDWGYLAHVEEGLGTKNLIADAMYKQTGSASFYRNIAIDTVAMIVNDLITSGAKTLSVAMHLAVGDSDWFKDEVRVKQLISGWKAACDLAGCSWGGGETPTLKGLVNKKSFLLSGSAIGVIQPKSRRIKDNLRPGDRIILLESSGLHANGATLARKLAEKLPQGYLIKLKGGKTYGKALLAPTIIYAPVIERLLSRGIVPSYVANITGHGWKKVMRSPKPLTYVFDKLPAVPEVLSFMQEKAKLGDGEAYSTFNMGAGFAIFVRPNSAKDAIFVAESCGIKALLAGMVKENKDKKKCVILPNGVEYQKQSPS